MRGRNATPAADVGDVQDPGRWTLWTWELNTSSQKALFFLTLRSGRTASSNQHLWRPQSLARAGEGDGDWGGGMHCGRGASGGL